MTLPDCDEWVLRPFVSFGPVKMSLTLADALKTLGPPHSQRVLDGLTAGHELNYLAGSKTVKLWFDGHKHLTFVTLEGVQAALVQEGKVPVRLDFLEEKGAAQLTPNLRAFAGYGVTLFHKPGAVVRLTVNTFAHMKTLLPNDTSVPAKLTEKGGKAPTLKALLEKNAALKKVERAVWLPQFKGGADVLQQSKLNGAPWLLKGEQHPVCPGCETPLTLIVQLVSKELPKPLQQRFKGVLQFFFCAADACFYDEVDGSAVLRVIEPVATKVKSKAPPKLEVSRRSCAIWSPSPR